MNKVLFVIGTLGNGGAERVIATLSNNFNLKGIKVKIILIYGNRCDYMVNSNVELSTITCTNKFRLFRPFERFQKIRKSIIDFKPDCVISFLADVNIHTLISMCNLNIPLIVCERNDPEKDPSRKWVRYLRDKIYKYADGFVFQTPDAMKYFDGKISTYKLRTIISNPLTQDLPFHTFVDGNRRIITACRLNSQKNLILMIDAVSNVVKSGVNCELDIYGMGPLQNKLENYINELKMDEYIHLKGFSNNIHTEMQNSCMFVISSDYEGISNSMLEALAIGVPVIATDCPVGGARMFIENNISGILTKVGDRYELEEAIKRILNDPYKAEEMGRKASEIRKLLNIENISNEWINFIRVVINNVEGNTNEK